MSEEKTMENIRKDIGEGQWRKVEKGILVNVLIRKSLLFVCSFIYTSYGTWMWWTIRIMLKTMTLMLYSVTQGEGQLISREHTEIPQQHQICVYQLQQMSAREIRSQVAI